MYDVCENKLTAKNPDGSNALEAVLELMSDEGCLTYEKLAPMPPSLSFTVNDNDDVKASAAFIYRFWDKAKKAAYIAALNEEGYANLEDILHAGKLIPQPDLAYATDYEIIDSDCAVEMSYAELANLMLSNILNFGYVDWYKWRLDNWGNVCDIMGGKSFGEYLMFTTAYCVPWEFFDKVSALLPDIEITIEYAAEDYANAGVVKWLGGEQIDVKEPMAKEDIPMRYENAYRDEETGITAFCQILSEPYEGFDTCCEVIVLDKDFEEIDRGWIDLGEDISELSWDTVLDEIKAGTFDGLLPDMFPKDGKTLDDIEIDDLSFELEQQGIL